MCGCVPSPLLPPIRYRNAPYSDGVHRSDAVAPGSRTRESLSEATKRLKPLVLLRLAEQLLDHSRHFDHHFMHEMHHACTACATCATVFCDAGLPPRAMQTFMQSM